MTIVDGRADSRSSSRPSSSHQNSCAMSSAPLVRKKHAGDPWLQNRRGGVKVVCVTIVERDRNGVSPRVGTNQLMQRQDAILSLQRRNLLCKLLRRNAQTPRIDVALGNAVIHEHDCMGFRSGRTARYSERTACPTFMATWTRAVPARRVKLIAVVQFRRRKLLGDQPFEERNAGQYVAVLAYRNPGIAECGGEQPLE